MSKHVLLATVEAATRKVDAIETLAASLTAGLHAGVVHPDHLYTLMTCLAGALGEDLRQLASAVEATA